MGSGLVLRVSSFVALGGACLLSFFFVASLYLWKLLGYEDTNRDSTGTIQRRFLSAIFASGCAAWLIWVLAEPAAIEDGGMSFASMFGWGSPETGRACAYSLGLAIALFTGPIVQHGVAVWIGEAKFVSMPGAPWVALRNYVLAPFTEEFVFRACLCRLLVGASFSNGVIIVFSPFFFAMAHSHHFIEHVRRLRDKRAALARVLFQIFYTSLFGMFSNFLLLRTGSTLAVMLVHSFCNHQGFPDPGFLVSQRHPLFEHRWNLSVAYGNGIAAFCWLLVPWTSGFRSSFVPIEVVPAYIVSGYDAH